MPIPAVNNVNSTNTNSAEKRKVRFNSVKVTGYASLGFGIASGVAAARKKIKLHKNLAYLALAAAVIHTGIIEYWHLKSRKK